MILSDAGIRRALAEGDISIDPDPEPGQLQTSAVDIFLGDSFRVWDLARLATPGLTPVLDLAEQRFAATANSFSINAELERDGSYILKPYREVPHWVKGRSAFELAHAWCGSGEPAIPEALRLLLESREETRGFVPDVGYPADSSRSRVSGDVGEPV